ncbi:MAG: hypothetical protein A2031_07295 [Deltaproteobacteria bacterium RBG_19FT_COMBO_43_11]|nr:MAG: hypothetical protein A2031_07295 [Deltaproteobacteria bacterium RBG_19FT_COMBO_43_11]
MIFEEGFNIYKIIIVSEGGIFDSTKKLFIINKDNFETVKYTIFVLCKNKFETEETKTLLTRFSEILLEI